MMKWEISGAYTHLTLLLTAVRRTCIDRRGGKREPQAQITWPAACWSAATALVCRFPTAAPKAHIIMPSCSCRLHCS